MPKSRKLGAEIAAGENRPSGVRKAVPSPPEKILAREQRGRHADPFRTIYHGADIVNAFLSPTGQISIDEVADYFGMSKVQLGETMGLARDTLYRAERRGSPKAQSRAIEMLEIIGRILGWAGGEKQAMAWFRAEPIPAFGGRTAESLLKEGKATAVRDYLDHVAIGGFA